MKYGILLALRNPLVIVPPVVVVLGIGWQQYTYAGRNLSLPAQSKNLLPNSDFSQVDSANVPIGWQVGKNGTANYQTSISNGYAGGNSFKVVISQYQNGDIALTSPKMNVSAGKTYLFKGYFKTDTPFTLLVRDYYQDGSSTLHFVQDYPGNAGSWATASDAFKTTPDLAAVQYVYHLYANGNLELNGLYLEPKEDVYIDPTLAGTNTVPNGSLGAGDYSAPDHWSTFNTGANQATFSYDQDSSGSYVQARMEDFKDGESKWQYEPQPVQPYQRYQFSVTYRGDIRAPVVAEYTLKNGERQDQTITQVMPSDSWTTMSYKFEVPPNATNVFLSLPLQHNGTLATRNYTLIDITKPGEIHWQRPLISITFDDGWQLSYENAVPILREYGYKATFFINPSTIETPNFMTADELTSLSRDGNEIAAHGYDHDDMTAISTSELDYQLHEGRDYLRAAGFKVTDFATPYGRSDAEVQWYARKYFSTVRSTDTGINTRQNLDPYDLKVLYVNDFTTSSTITTALQEAKAYNGWLIFVYHRIGEGNPNYPSLHVESPTVTGPVAQKQLNLIHRSGLPVLPLSAAYEEVAKQ